MDILGNRWVQLAAAAAAGYFAGKLVMRQRITMALAGPGIVDQSGRVAPGTSPAARVAGATPIFEATFPP